MEEYLSMFVAEFRDELKNRKMTQRAFAKKAGYTEAYISGMLLGTSNMSHKVCAHIAETLNMKLIMCLGDKE